MPFWSSTSTTLPNDVTYVNNTYKDANGNNKLTTISSTNTTGYVPIDSNSTDPIVKKTSYAVQNDGKITYQYDDGNGNKIQYNSIQEIANDGIGGYTDATTAKLKDSMQRNLSTSATEQRVGPNAATTDPNSQTGNPDAAPIDEKTSQENLDKLSNIKLSDRSGTRSVNEYPDNLKYPITLRSEEQDCVRFTMLQYAPRKIDIKGISSGNPTSERSTTENRTRGKTVILPIQPTISDNNTVKWGSNEMNAGQLIAASAALATITEGAEGAIASIKQITDLFKGSASDLKTAFAAGYAGAAVGTKGLLTRVTGGIINPNMELLFEGPDLRTFNFTFSLSAREPNEAKVIRNIIRFFKQGMSVKRASTGLFLKSPHTFEIKYFHAGKEHEWINKIKECALTSCNVNYTPAGNYATYEDGAITQYDLTLSFSELEPIYDDEYGKGSTTYESEIGF